MSWSYPDRIPLGHFPTPLEPLPNLSRSLDGPELWIKRDDQTGLATGGNKTRKLEFVLAEAIAHDADHLVTLGGPQSNHCRQTAAAAAKLGLGCSLVLGGHAPPSELGNLLLDGLFGAEIYWAGTCTREEVANSVVEALQSQGKRPYVIPLGASTGLGAVGYVAALEELIEQCFERHMSFDAVVLASSSAGTQAGLVLGAATLGFAGRILGISIDAKREDLEQRVLTLAEEGASRIASKMTIHRGRVRANDDYLGGGYAVVGQLERDAIRMMARSEGILLDPVYTGRAMGGLIDLISKGVFERSDRILFWHTGGAASMSAFHTELAG